MSEATEPYIVVESRGDQVAINLPAEGTEILMGPSTALAVAEALVKHAGEAME